MLQHGPGMKILSAGIVVRSLDATDATRLIVASAIATSIQTAAKSDLNQGVARLEVQPLAILSPSMRVFV